MEQPQTSEAHRPSGCSAEPESENQLNALQNRSPEESVSMEVLAITEDDNSSITVLYSLFPNV